MIRTCQTVYYWHLSSFTVGSQNLERGRGMICAAFCLLQASELGKFMFQLSGFQCDCGTAGLHLQPKILCYGSILTLERLAAPRNDIAAPFETELASAIRAVGYILGKHHIHCIPKKIITPRKPQTHIKTGLK